MLFHKIATYHGKEVRDGKEFHAYKTICGAPMVAVAVFKQGQLVSVGEPPHAQCAACFKSHQAQSGSRVIEGDHRAVADTDKGFGSLGRPAEGAMLDDLGNPISAPIDSNPMQAAAADDPFSGKTLGVKRTQREGDRIIKTEIDDPMGSIESSFQF